MSPITKWLGAIATILIAIEFFGPALHHLLFESVTSQQLALTNISRQLKLKERALRQAEATVRKFEQHAQLSFESDLAKARLTYQEYLLHLTDTCSLSGVMISSSQPERLDELGHILHFSIQASGTTQQFGMLIDGFYRTAALHRIAHINIYQSLGPDSPTHSLTLDVKVLVLDSPTKNRGGLSTPNASSLKDSFASHDIFRKQVAEPAQSESPLASGMSMLSSLLNNVPTAPTETIAESAAVEPEAPKETAEAIQPAVVDPKSKVRLVGIITRGTKKHAVFIDTAENIQHTVTVESSLDMLGIHARVIQIGNNDVKLAEDSQRLKLGLGCLYNEAISQQ